jgi:hypothetical protein
MNSKSVLDGWIREKAGRRNEDANYRQEIDGTNRNSGEQKS